MTEGILRPSAPRRSPPPGRGVDPVRLLAPGVPSPFAPGRDVTFARVSGDLLARTGLRDGDHVAVVRRDVAREGDVASVVRPDGTEALYALPPPSPDGSSPARAQRGRPRVRGVVVGVLRKL